MPERSDPRAPAEYNPPRPIAPLECDMRNIAVNARREGFRLVDRLISDWETGANRFSGAGECFYGVSAGDDLIAIGGLNSDPYAEQFKIGRLRRFYVLPAHRRKGVGRMMVSALLQQARENFSKVRLRTGTHTASLFYLSCGFSKIQDVNATHEFYVAARK